MLQIAIARIQAMTAKRKKGGDSLSSEESSGQEESQGRRQTIDQYVWTAAIAVSRYPGKRVCWGEDMKYCTVG